MQHLIHLKPPEAVAEARRSGDPEAVKRLDRYLRARLIEFLQNREGDRSELADALLDARTWAAREHTDHVERWSLFLEILEKSRNIPSTVEQVDLLTDTEAAILAQLVIDTEDLNQLRPKDLAERLGKSEQNVNNYLRRMEEAGLVSRHRVPGKRTVWVFATHKAVQLAEKLGLSKAEPARPTEAESRQPTRPLAEPIPLWPTA